MAEEDGVCAALTFGTLLDHFAESEEVFSLVDALPEVCNDLRARENAHQRFTAILDGYQAQPHLLDSHLENLVSQLFLLTARTDVPNLRQQAFCYLYILSKVRGAKILIRWFPHEVRDLEPALKLLSEQDPTHTETWETRYVLLLWLSILVMIPFDLCRMDGSQVTTPTSGKSLKIVDRIFDIGKVYIGVQDKCRDAAALLMARFITRPDVKEMKMEEFISWALDIMCVGDVVYIPGVLQTLTSLFKHAKRDDVVGAAPAVLQQLCQGDLAVTFDINQRKSFIKLAQWVGVVFLPPRIAEWRYQRGGRSLEETLGSATPSATPTQTPVPAENAVAECDDGVYDVPAEVEEILGLLLRGLQDGHTTVRWPAAKGVGRVTSRLPRALADEVVLSLLELFKSRENDVAWHGGCLALAELGRRGLLLPERLRDVVPVVVKALAYDEKRGSYSVGAPVRDAACYLTWSFARSYRPEELHPYVHVLASALLVSMLFDREVQCRRAASAAFQENVGRVGNFPHGIEILTLADYFALGNRSNAFLNVSVEVASFPEYCRPLVEHLVQYKLAHWDIGVRELAAKALHNLTSLDSTYMRDEVLRSVLPLVTSPDPCMRHGALHAVAELTHSFLLMANKNSVSFPEYVGVTLTSQLLQVAPKLQKAAVFKGAIGEMMRPAALKFVKNICECQVPIRGEEGGEEALEAWQTIVEENFAHTEEAIQESAVAAFTALCKAYYCMDTPTITKYQARLIKLCTEQLHSHSHFSRMGHALAIGGLPLQLLGGAGILRGQILDPLMKNCTAIHDNDPRFTEARKCAVIAITRLCCTVGVSVANGNSYPHPCDDSADVGGRCCEPHLSGEDVRAVFDALMVCLGDYTINRRGDIGAVVREEAMIGLHTITTTLLSTHPSLLTPDMMRGVVCGLVQQSNEKIDRTRALACQKLMGVVYHDPALPHIPQHSRLQHIFKEMAGSEVNHATPQLTFPLTVQLLSLPEYRDHTLLGLIVSVGGLTESTVRASGAALLDHLRPVSKDADTLLPFSESVLMIMRSHAQEARLITPLFKTLDLLFSNGIFDAYNSLESHPFPESIFELAKVEVKGCKDAVKLLASINVFCGLVQFLAVRGRCLRYIMYLLCHSFPKVRKSTADQFYLSLLTFDDLVDEDIVEDVTALLSETAWDGPVVEVRKKRNSLCELLQVPIPKLVAKPSSNKPKVQKDEMESYRDLVDRAGY